MLPAATFPQNLAPIAVAVLFGYTEDAMLVNGHCVMLLAIGHEEPSSQCVDTYAFYALLWSLRPSFLSVITFNS